MDATPFQADRSSAAAARSNGNAVLDRNRSLAIAVDLQTKLLRAIPDAPACLNRAKLVLGAARALGVPAVITEQYPQGIGSTDPAVLEAYPDAPVIGKMTFSSWNEPAFKDAVERFAANLPGGPACAQLVVFGTEAHVCALQTALDLNAAGYAVFFVADASASRSEHSRALADARARGAGITVINAEMAAFEWLREAGTAEFKALLPLIK